MEKKTKFIIIALVGILAISIFINFWIFSLKKTAEQQRSRLKNENETLAINIKEINQENKHLQDRINLLSKDLDKVTKEKEEMQKKFELANKSKDQLAEQLKSVNAKLMKAGDEKQQIQENLSSTKRKNMLLRRQLKSLINRKRLLERKLVSLHKENIGLSLAPLELETQVENVITPKLQLKKQLVASTGPVELPPIVVYAQPEAYLRQPQEATASEEKQIFTTQAPIATIPIEGRVLGVNRENNFVVIDLGEDSGIKLSDIFKVFRKDKVVATIEVIQTRKRVAACDIKNEIKPIQVGDVVR